VTQHLRRRTIGQMKEESQVELSSIAI
jgi:hypothetical protein